MKFSIYLFLILAVACNNSTPEIDEDVEQKYLFLEEEINKYISQKQGEGGYGGELFCRSKLFGGDDNSFYLVFICQEFYSDGDSVSVGTSVFSPALIKHRDSLIIEVHTPGLGAAYSRDIKKMFPANISKKMLDQENFREVKQELDAEFDSIKKDYGEEMQRNKLIFQDIFENRLKADFYAAGAEPFWTLYIKEDKLIFRNPTGQVDVYKMLNSFDKNLIEQEINYKTKSSDTVKIIIRKERTFHELANDYFPYKVIRDSISSYLNGVGDIQPLNY